MEDYLITVLLVFMAIILLMVAITTYISHKAVKVSDSSSILPFHKAGHSIQQK